ncbi:MAG TPA: toxin-antitoxin system HicB family antitoxin [Acidimicrobiales bacterium]|jgi:predicted HicB family RNase H-like nuclease|nr:toxin-antitoxin system HicB family antitoxin [Acidimicrobiales bacterium]
MKMSLMVDGLRADVVSIGELGDDTVAEVADRIAEVLGRSMPARILDLLSDVAAEVSAELPEGRVEIRVAGDDVGLAYVEDARVQSAGESDADRDLSARISLRLSESLKARLEEGAAREGISVNAFIVRTLDRGASNSQKRNSYAGSRLRGYGTT